MEKEVLEQFKRECLSVLSAYDLHQLRAYARNVGVKEPTKKTLGPLLESIIGVLAGEIPPVERSTRGAPVKSDFFDPKIPVMIENVRIRANAGFSKPQDTVVSKRDIVKEIADFQASNKNRIVFNSPNISNELSKRGGQLTTFDGVSYLLPLNCRDNGEKVVVPIEFIRDHGLKEGDVLDCLVEKGKNVFVAVKLLSVNGCALDKYRRLGDFEEMSAAYPTQPIRFYKTGCENSVTSKYVDWLLAIGKGQRCRILSAPKAGKTELIYELVKSVSTATPELSICVLLIEQSPETISRFRKIIKEDCLVYSTYDDTPERQVFTADFVLKRAKRMAESGKDVLLFVDSFNALARAYNDTSASSGGKLLACGLESKTVQYIKKFFGSARNLEKGGSITVLGAVSCDSGIPADDYIATELSTLANAEIVLSESLVMQRTYPAINLSRSIMWNGVEKFENADKLRAAVLEKYLTKVGEKELRNTLEQCSDYDNFAESIYKQLQS
ncbi:MAG: hypothetical protein E7357_05420 [Clostridiales bacterium]|nr:hypothetical protein [Clostridiales bacterium]